MDYLVLRKAIDEIVRLSEDDFAAISAYSKRQELKKGEVLLKQGETCRSLYLVESGYLRTWYNKDGLPINTNFTFEGSFITVVKSVRDRQPSDLTIETGEESIVWTIHLDKLPAEVAVRPELARFIKKMAIRLLLAAEAHNDLLKFHTPVERYHYVEKNNPLLLQRIPLSQIASYLGMARETLSRIRARIS